MFKRFKGNDSLQTGEIRTDCKIHQGVMMVHIECKFQRILYICYLVTAAFDDFTLIQGQEFMHY